MQSHYYIELICHAYSTPLTALMHVLHYSVHFILKKEGNTKTLILKSSDRLSFTLTSGVSVSVE